MVGLCFCRVTLHEGENAQVPQAGALALPVAHGGANVQGGLQPRLRLGELPGRQGHHPHVVEGQGFPPPVPDAPLDLQGAGVALLGGPEVPHLEGEVCQVVPGQGDIQRISHLLGQGQGLFVKGAGLPVPAPIGGEDAQVVEGHGRSIQVPDGPSQLQGVSAQTLSLIQVAPVPGQEGLDAQRTALGPAIRRGPSGHQRPIRHVEAAVPAQPAQGGGIGDHRPGPGRRGLGGLLEQGLAALEVALEEEGLAAGVGREHLRGHRQFLVATGMEGIHLLQQLGGGGVHQQKGGETRDIRRGGPARNPDFPRGLHQFVGEGQGPGICLGKAAPDEQRGTQGPQHQGLLFRVQGPGGVQMKLGEGPGQLIRFHDGEFRGGAEGTGKKLGHAHFHHGIVPGVARLVPQGEHRQTGRPFPRQIRHDAAAEPEIPQPHQQGGQRERGGSPLGKGRRLQHAVQGFGHVPSRGPLIGVHRQHRAQQQAHARGDLPGYQGLQLAVQGGLHAVAARAWEGMVPQQQFPGHDAQREDVTGGTRPPAAQLFRRRVGGAAHEVPRLGQLPGPIRPGARLSGRPYPGGLVAGRTQVRSQGAPAAIPRFLGKGEFSDPFGVCCRRRAWLHEPGQAEVQDLHLALRIHHDVAGLEVAVDDALGMGRLQGPGHGAQRAQLPGGVQTGRSLGEKLPLNEFHGDETLSLPVDQIVDLANIPVVELGQGEGLPAEALLGLLEALILHPQRLERDRALQHGIPGPVDGAHATLPQQALHHEPPHLNARCQAPVRTHRRPGGNTTGTGHDHGYFLGKGGPASCQN